MRVGMVWAEARGADGRGAIGRGGDMPWHLPEDLAHFKSSTMGDPVVMGRRTWESLPERFRPLPGRQNVVVSRDERYTAAGAVVVPSLEAALDQAATFGTAEPTEAAWVIGGGQIFLAAMPLATELVVTRIDLDIPDADTFAPEIGPEWELVDAGTPLVSRTGLGYRFERWTRRS
ncbi:dihydrofolate reductase [Leucobacter sp. GX24907]